MQGTPVLARKFADARDQDHEILDGYAEERQETDAGRDAQVLAGEIQRNDPADSGVRHIEQYESCVLNATEGEAQEHEDGDQRERNDHGQLLLRDLHLVELAVPADGIAAVEMHLGVHEFLRLGDGASQVAPAYTEFDGDVAPSGFAVDEERPICELDVGNQAYRNAAAVGRIDKEAADVIKIAARRLWQAHE